MRQAPGQPPRELLTGKQQVAAAAMAGAVRTMPTEIGRAWREHVGAARLLWRHARGHKLLLGTFVGLSVLGVVTESFGVFLLVPLLESMGSRNIFSDVPLLGEMSRLFDALPAEQRLVWAGLIMLAVVLLRGALQMAQEYLGYALPHRVDLALRREAFDALSAAEMRHLDRLGIGEVSSLAVAHPARIGIALRFAALFVANVAVLVCFVAVLAAVTPVVSAAAILYLVLSTLLFKHLTASVIARIGAETTAATERFSQVFYEAMGAARLVRLAGATDAVRHEVHGSLRHLRRARDRTVLVENMTAPFFSVIGGLLICGLVIAVGLAGNERAGQAVAMLIVFVVLLMRVLAPLSIINIARSNIAIHLDAFREYERMFEAAHAAREPSGEQAYEGLDREIRLDGVGFAYAPDRAPALDGVDLVIPRGTVTAVIGPSGAGKSTLVDLLARLHRPTSGRILVDGRPLDGLAIDDWRRRLAVVSQEVVLVDGTVRANLLLGLHRDVPVEELTDATRRAALLDWIETLPEAWETRLGSRGRLLSGGERQRLAIARALLRRPEILVLDEATSALDPLTEAEVQRELVALGATRIIIAHRLATVRSADRIVVLEKGRVVETGTHHELVHRNGLYARMLGVQPADVAVPLTIAAE